MADPDGVYGPIVDRLESVAADLDDLAFDRLREAVADGELRRPDEDRRLMQARRSIAKAAAILRRLDEPDGRDGQDEHPDPG